MLSLETSPYFRDLDWEKLKAFYYVAKVGNISQAAPYLNLAQSSFSRQITKLEKHLGYPLFSRSRNGVVLTRKGEELLIIIENMFLDMKKFTSQTYVSLNQEKKRKIRIATSHALAAYLINDFILDYHETHPDLVFEIIEVNDAPDIILNDVDIAIRPHTPQIPKTEQVNWQVMQEPLFVLKKKLYASPQYLKQYGEPQQVSDLQHHHFILSSPLKTDSFDDAKWILGIGTGGSLRREQLSKEDSQNREPVFLSNSLECLIKAAQQGKGIISTYDKMTILKNTNLQNILPDLVIKKHLVYFTYPEYLKDDQDIINIKGYLRDRTKVLDL